MHRVMVDGGSGAEIVYLNLFRGLGLKEKDLESYGALLMGFDWKMVIPNGRIKLTVQVEKEEVLVDFIVVDVYSPYTAILARLWLHALGAVSSTLHQKVKFLTEGRIEEIRGRGGVSGLHCGRCVFTIHNYSPYEKNQATCPSREGGGVSGLHYGGRVFTIHNYSCSVVATCSWSRIFHSAPKCEIPY